ncbi:hypothetical protein [Streptomyces sp. S186]|uniref:hypothetical protein n=1 Tax=Streptomyces sp. S186 TaxID=3434395 RepID=UPI003F67FA42
MDPVPAGKLLVVEHVSGYLAVSENHAPFEIYATEQTTFPRVYLPVYSVSDPLDYGNPFGSCQNHHFGSPVRMYVAGPDRVTVIGDADRPASICASVVGYLV